jgi:hypothetical protein
MKDFSCVDETLDLNRAHAYRLSIQVSLDGFSFSILDQVRGKFVVLKHRNFSPGPTPDDRAEELDSFLSGEETLQSGYKKSLAMAATRKSTLIPEPFFREDHLKQYLAFNHDMDELDEIHYNYLPEIDAYTVFAVPNPISNVIRKHLHGVTYFHQGLPFIRWHVDNATGLKKTVAISLYGAFLDIGVFSKDKLHFYNSFSWSTPEDILYYILHIYRQFTLDVSLNRLYVTGHTRRQDDIKKLIRRYIKKVHFLEPPEEYTYSYTFQSETARSFTNLFRLNLCV